MKYDRVQIGRSFIVKFDHNDDFYTEIHRLCDIEEIHAGFVTFLGAIKKSSVVVGPRDESLPPKPVMRTINTPHEVVGVGSIFMKDGKPSVHTHTIFSDQKGSFVGCIRDISHIFIVVEAYITEFINCNAVRTFDEETGLDLLDIA